MCFIPFTGKHQDWPSAQTKLDLSLDFMVHLSYVFLETALLQCLFFSSILSIASRSSPHPQWKKAAVCIRTFT